MSCSLFCCEDIQSPPRLWTVRRALRFRGLWERNFTRTPCYVARKQVLYLEDNRGESRANGTRKETRELQETKLKRSVRAVKIACHSK